ncbi:MAG TPA: mycofactocin biosynthesis glycosyltransferase MftF [Streptosporangiaceae bacterium]|jgi:mycofactocin system glycosyltransferase
MTGALDPAEIPAPTGLRLAADPGLQWLAGDRVLLGGAPLRLVRLRPGGARRARAWAAGEPLGPGRAERMLARRLLDAGLFHPRPSDGPPGGPPGPVAGQVTIVVPVHDRPEALRRCLAALRGTAPHSPVIVVDDGSADRLAAVRAAAGVAARYVRRDRRGGPAAARNTGLAAATTPYIAFVDSDCVPVGDWLRRLLAHFTDPAVAAAAPRIVGHEAAGRRGVLARYEETGSSLDMGPRESLVRPAARVPYVPSATVVVRRAALADATRVARPRAVGAAFDEVMPVGEDVDLIWRFTASGWRVRYDPAATVAHEHRTRPYAWFTRRADYGMSAAPLALRHPHVLPAVSMSGWSAAAWALAAAGRPLAALALTAAVTTRLADRLAPTLAAADPRSEPDARVPSAAAGAYGAFPLAVRLVGMGTLGAGRLLGSAVTRTWWPVAVPAALAVRRLRVPVAAAIVGPATADWVGDWRARRRTGTRPPLDPVRYVAVRICDDVAYSIGVWRGCLRHRTVRPLLPRLWWRQAAGDVGGPAA